MYLLRVLICVLLMTVAYGGHGRRRRNSNSEPRSIAPVAECKGELIDMGPEIRRCYIQCEGYSEPKKGVTIEIQKLYAKGPDVLECRKIRMEQKFTQTWLFASVPGDLKITHLDISIDECKSAREKNCPAGSCNVREPDSLTPEYHYASTTTVSIEVITLMTAESTIWYDRGVEYISPLGSSSSFRSEIKEIVENKVSYIWGSVTAMKECPYSSVGKYGCDEFDEKDELFYSCSGGDVTVTPKSSPSDVHADLCPGSMVSEEGFIYKIVKEKPDSDKRGRIAIDVNEGTAESADTTYVRHKVQQVAMKLSSDICYTQCEVVSLEVRTSDKKEHLVRMGNRHYLYYPNGTAQLCYPTHGCRLPENLALCGGPPRIGIMCNGKTRLWDPTLPYLLEGGVCHKPDRVEQLEFILGNQKYNVDKDLMIPLNKSQYHGIYQSEFMRYHNGAMTMSVTELKDIRKKWDSAKDGPVSKSREESRKTEIDSPHASLGAWVTGAVSGIFQSVHTIETVVGLCLVVAVIGITLKLMVVIWGVNKKLVAPKGDYALVEAPSRNAAVWI